MADMQRTFPSASLAALSRRREGDDSELSPLTIGEEPLSDDSSTVPEKIAELPPTSSTISPWQRSLLQSQGRLHYSPSKISRQS